MEKALHIFSRFIAGLAIVVTQWFRQRIHSFGYHRLQRLVLFQNRKNLPTTRRLGSIYFTLALLLLAVQQIQAQGTIPMQKGMAVLTCFSGVAPNKNDGAPQNPNGPVLAIFDIRDPQGNGAPFIPVNIWAAPTTGAYHPANWSAANMGELFGVALEEGATSNPAIFASTTGITAGVAMNLVPKTGGTGGEVFRVDGTTGAVSSLATLPNTTYNYIDPSGVYTRYVGLGDITYNRKHNVVYVSNLDNGLVYAINATTGATMGTPFNHNTALADNTGQPFTQLERMVFGVVYRVEDNKLYYAVKAPGSNSINPADSFLNANQIYTVNINPDGSIDAASKSAAPVITSSPTNDGSGNMVSDIALSSNGSQMLIAEMNLEYQTDGTVTVPRKSAHNANVYKYSYAGAAWAQSLSYVGEVGTFGATRGNSAGGVDFGFNNYGQNTPATNRDDAAVITGDQLNSSGAGGSAFGFQISNSTSPNTFATAYVVDLDGATGVNDNDKFTSGDIEVYGDVIDLVCSLTLKPTVSGCYQNAGSSKATVSVEVSWENATISPTANDASDAITVTFGGQTKSINPGAYTSTGGNGTIVSPQVVAFELPADASSQTAQAFIGADYVSSTCKVEQTGIVLPAACPPTTCLPGQTGGTVWNDFNADGIKQPGETTGIAGVTVNAYDCKGVLIASTTTDASGKYVFTNISLPSYPIRVEFVNLPAYAGQGTINGTDGRTTVQFVNAADCNVDLGILDNADYCQTNPKIVVPCYVSGDPLVAGTSAGSDAVVSFDYSASGLQNTAIMAHAPASEVGALWGMAYNKYTKKIFSSATVKRHVGLGPLGLGGIYVADFSTVPANGSTFAYSNFIDVSTLGINVGIIASNSARGLLGDRTQPSVDNDGYLKVGKAGIGGIDLSVDGNTLYFTNLFDNKLYAIDITAYNTSGTLPTSANVKSYDMSNGINCTGGDLHTWGVKVHKGKVYTGMVCDASVSQNKSDLRAYVQELNGTTVSTIFDFPLSYPKGFPNWGDTTITGWYPWTDNWASKILPANPFALTHPEPIFSSIEFDIDGSMILAFGDRTGIQTGLNNYNPNGNDGKSYSSALGGDILRAYSNGTSFVLENNAKAGPNVGYGANNNQGPGFGEFYNDNLFFEGTRLGHAENAIGGLALRAGSGEVIEIAMDPLDAPIGADGGLYFNAAGLRHLNNTSGLTTQSYIIYNGLTPGAQGKASGLGDAVLLCDVPTYLEIGNRVWNDTDKDGIQDPCEKVLTGVNVSLYKGITLIATTTTDVNGEYYFSTKSKIGTGTWSGTGADTTLSPTTGYKLVFGAGQTTGGALTVAGLGQFILTVKDATANNGNDQNDSDAELLSGAFCINLTTGALASVNHTFDVGFICTNPAIGNKITQTAPTCTATTENNNGKLTLTAAVTPYDRYRLKTGTAAWSGDTTYATATAIGSTFPKDLVTTAPNAGATYVVRFYTGECCYKDTTITVLPSVCVVGSIGDYVWKDANRNGKQDAGETGVNGVQVILWSATTTGTPVAKLDSMTTAGTGANAGKYLFSNLPKGDYVVQFVKSTIPAECSGFTAKDTTAAGTTDKNDSDADKVTGITAKITLDPKALSGTSTPADSLATNNLTVDAGLVAPQGSLGDFVWKDTNNNGIQDETTPNGGGVAGVQVELYKNGTLFAKDTTDATGRYLFSNLDAGTYKIKVLSASIPAGCELSAIKDAPSDDAKDSDVDKTTGESGNYVIDPTDPTKKDILTVDAALYSPKGSLGDFVWKDTNNNGIQDETTPNGGGVAGVQVELYKNGTLFAKDTTDATGKYLFSNLDAGTYKIKVLSASIPAGCEISSVKDAPSDDAKDSDVDKTTGESGNYVIDPLDPTKKDIVTVDAALYSPKGSLGDFVWKDTNNNGIQDETTPNGGGVANVIVELYKNGTLFAKDTTDATGKYLFSNLDAGTYKIKVLSASIPAGCELSSVKDAPSDDAKDSDVDKTTGESGNYVIDPLDPTKKDILTVDAALYSPKGSLGDFVWKDTNNNGIQDETTPNGGGVAGVQIELYKNGTLFAKDTTDAQGKYLFTNLDAGTYKIKVLSASIPAGCEISNVKDAPSDDAKDSDVDKTTGESGNYVIDPLDPTKKDILTVDAGLYSPKGSLGDFVWKDTNNNGIQDETTPNAGGVAGVQVELYKNGTLFAKDTTDATGKYLFTNLDAGTYKIKVLSASIPAGCELSAVKDAPSDDAKDSDVDKTTGESGNYVIDPTDPTKKDILTVDAALYSPKGSLGDFVWKDTNNNGIQDETTPNGGGVANVIVELYKNGTLFAKDTTDATGKYLFSNLDAGIYKIKVLSASIPAGCEISGVKDAPSDDAKDSDVDKTTGESGNYVIDPLDPTKKDILTVDAALYSPKGSLGDFVWKDTNNNGIQDETTPNGGGVAGVQVELYKNGTLFAKDTTDATGKYLFTNLDAGTYKIKVLSASIPAGCELSAIKDAPSDDAKDSDVDKTTGESGNYVIDPTDPTKKDILTVDAGLAVPCVKSKVALIGTPACSADVQTYSLTFSVTGKNGIIKVNKGTLTGSNPYTVTGIPSGATVKITDSLSAICKSDTLITGPNCNCNPPTPVLITQSLTACIGDTFPTIKATVVGLATVEWFATATSTAVLFTGLNYKPAGNVTAAGATFYAQARSTDPTCPAAISTSRVMATVNAQNCTVEVDLALKKSINTKIAQIGDVLTYTLKVWNESSTNATGVEVVDSIATTVQFQAGSFTASRGTATITGNVIKWVIGNIAANGDTVTLTYRIKATQEGVHFNTAEICKTNEKDVDSTPCNHDDEEDDIDRQCFSVPVKLCPDEKAEVNVPANLTNVQWFKNGGTTAIGSGNVILLSEVGTYTFTATNQTCPANGCCPIIIEPGINCCPEDLCIPFTIKQTKKGKK